MRHQDFDETNAWRLWKAIETADTPTKHPAKTTECLSFAQFEKRRYTFAQLMHLASCSYCQKTDWMFHHTPLAFKFLALVSPAKRIIQPKRNTVTEVYPEQPREQFINIPDALLHQESNLLKEKTNAKDLIRDRPSTRNRKFLQLTPQLFASARLLVFLEVDLQNNQFDVVLELRQCEAHQVGQVIPNCHVIFKQAQKQIANVQTSEYGACGVYGLNAGTYQVVFDKYPHVSLELELLNPRA